MGFNTAVTIFNDNIGDLKKHPEEFVKQLQVLINDGGHSFFGYVHPSQHASTVQVVAHGGNMSIPLVYIHNRQINANSREGQVEILRALAEKLGFDIVAKE